MTETVNVTPDATSSLLGHPIRRRATLDALPWVWEYQDLDRLLDEAIGEDTQAPYGAVLWNSSLVAAQWLSSRCFDGKVVIDLGAGNGLCALTAAQQGANAYAVDVDSKALALLERAASEQGLNVQTKEFDVFNDEELPSCSLLVVADVLYEPELAKAVAKCVFSAHQKGACVLVTDPQRYSRQIFLDTLREKGVTESFVDESYCFDKQKQRIGTLWLEA